MEGLAWTHLVDACKFDIVLGLLRFLSYPLMVMTNVALTVPGMLKAKSDFLTMEGVVAYHAWPSLMQLNCLEYSQVPNVLSL